MLILQRWAAECFGFDAIAANRAQTLRNGAARAAVIIKKTASEHARRESGKALWFKSLYVPDGPSSVALFKSGAVAAKNGRPGWQNPRSLYVVACLVTSNNRLAVKSPGPRPRDFFFVTHTIFVSMPGFRCPFWPGVNRWSTLFCDWSGNGRKR